MTLLNAPAYNERRETLKRNILVGGGILIVVLVLITLTGYVMGHGWFFINLPAEYKVKNFLNTVEQGDYAKASPQPISSLRSRRCCARKVWSENLWSSTAPAFRR